MLYWCAGRVLTAVVPLGHGHQPLHRRPQQVLSTAAAVAVVARPAIAAGVVAQQACAVAAYYPEAVAVGALV